MRYFDPRLHSLVYALTIAVASCACLLAGETSASGADGGTGSTCDHSCLDGTCANGTCDFTGVGNTVWTPPSPAVMPAAGALKVAVIGAQMVFSDQLPRNAQHPAMLQVQLGTGYNVQNFGDCCSSVSWGYPRQGETHPYLSGQSGITPLDNAGMPVMPGYQLGIAPSYVQSIPFAPDIVVIGAWGKHDTELANSLWNGMLDPVKFKGDYERMVTTYLNLPNKPRVIISTPIPLPKGAPMGPTTMVIWPVVKDTAAKYGLEIVDLYTRFLNHPELFKDDTHVSNEGGLETISDAVYNVIKQKAPPPPTQDGGTVDDASGAGGSTGGGSTEGGSGGSTGSDTGGATTGAGGATTGSGSTASGSSTSGGMVHDPSSATGGCACSTRGHPSPWSAGWIAALAAAATMRRRRRAA